MKAGIQHDLDEQKYHAHKALSCSRAKWLVPPSTPKRFKHLDAQPEEHKRHFDIGKAVHAKVLGTPLDVVAVQKTNRSKERVDADDYDTLSAKAHRAEIYAEGKVPLLRHEIARVDKMAEAVLANETARQIMELPSRAEVSAFWQCRETGIDCRARFDWLPDARDDKRLIVADLKTTGGSAYPKDFIKSAASFLYDMQQEWYRDGIETLGLDPDPAFLFVVVEKDEPHDVAVVKLPDDLAERGKALMDRTRRIYAECLAHDRWPGIPSGIHTADAPPYETYKYEEFVA